MALLLGHVKSSCELELQGRLEEMALLLGHVKSSCELELQGRLLSRRNGSLTRSCKVFLQVRAAR